MKHEEACMQIRYRAFSIALFVAAAGCAHDATAKRVTLAELDRGALANWQADGPLIVEFQPGDRLPVQLAFQSQFFELSAPEAPLELVATERSFVRFDENGIRTSSDGVDFEASAPGRFGVHFSSKRDENTVLRVEIVAPRHDD
jgi:hypothetical protein